MMRRGKLISQMCVLSLVILTACGMSLYRPISNKENPIALREEVLVQLNAGEYNDAEATASKLWSIEQTNETASLYALALASTAGIGLFDLTVKAINASGQNTSQGSDIFNALDSVLPEFTDEQLKKIQAALTILDSAPDSTSGKLKFQRCLTAGIYSIPTISSLQKKITAAQSTFSSLPTKLGSGSGNGCTASTATINAAAVEVNDTISTLGEIATQFATAISVIEGCFPSGDGQSAINSVSQQVNKLTQAADKGCAVPQSQKIGNYTLPSCLNDTIAAAGGESAVAGDGLVAGCELFLNCASGQCF